MYSIENMDGEYIAICDKPRYIKLKEKTGSYIECSAEEAEGVSVAGKRYNINGRVCIPNEPMAIISQKDHFEVIFENITETTNEAGFREQQLEFDLDADFRLTCLELGL